jgi:hypothetical protein
MGDEAHDAYTAAWNAIHRQTQENDISVQNEQFTIIKFNT